MASTFVTSVQGASPNTRPLVLAPPKLTDQTPAPTPSVAQATYAAPSLSDSWCLFSSFCWRFCRKSSFSKTLHPNVTHITNANTVVKVTKRGRPNRNVLNIPGINGTDVRDVYTFAGVTEK